MKAKYLLHDRDKKYGKQFASVARGTGIGELKTPYQAPKANAVCERYIGSMKRECLDYTLIFHRNHLSLVAKEYADYDNRSRPHQGIGQRIPAQYRESNSSQLGRSVAPEADFREDLNEDELELLKTMEEYPFLANTERAYHLGWPLCGGNLW